MRFLTDENLPRDVLVLLRQLGHDVADVRELRMSGSPDAEVARLARQEGRLLVTLDLDFANILQYPPSEYAGIIVLRVPHPTRQRVVRTLADFLAESAEQDMSGALVIVEPGMYRVRRG